MLGIIKHVMGFRKVLFRGFDLVSAEWELVAIVFLLTEGFHHPSLSGDHAMDFGLTDNLSAQITQHLTEKIITGVLKPGERIREAHLAKELGVSRAPIREALQILRKNRLIELTERRGARVAPLSEEYINWLYEILAELYSIIVRELIDRPDEGRMKRFVSSLGKMEEACDSDDESGYYQMRIEYALIGLEGSDNQLLKEIMFDLIPSVMRIQHLSLKRRLLNIKTTTGYLKKFNDSMANGDVIRGERAIRDLLECDREFAVKAIRAEKAGGTGDE